MNLDPGPKKHSVFRHAVLTRKEMLAVDSILIVPQIFWARCKTVPANHSWLSAQ